MFVLTWTIWYSMEKISIRKETSVAKMLGTLFSIIGALVVTLYHGPVLMSSHSDWVIGGGLLALQYILISFSYLVMVRTFYIYALQNKNTVNKIYYIYDNSGIYRRTQ